MDGIVGNRTSLEPNLSRTSLETFFEMICEQDYVPFLMASFAADFGFVYVSWEFGFIDTLLKLMW